jgi:hypothetical protein
MATGIVCGAAFIATLAPAPPAPPLPSGRDYRPNISTLRLPAKLDFCGEQIPLDDPEVRKRMDREFLLNLQWDGQVMLYLKRSAEFFPMFDSIMAQEGAPNDLKFLSVAESALYQAQSGKGAVGLWQFVAETAKRYGLQVDDYVDERRDPVKSTRAAVRLLKDNKARFGSWALSAAAYNMGEAATQDDMTFQSGSSYFDLYLNEETSRYLFRIVALKEIMLHPEKYGYYLEKNDYYRPIPSTTVAVNTDIPNLAQWAAKNGTTYKMVKLLNPWILKRALPKPAANDPYVIAIPIKEGE